MNQTHRTPAMQRSFLFSWFLFILLTSLDQIALHSTCLFNDILLRVDLCKGCQGKDAREHREKAARRSRGGNRRSD